VFQVVPVYDDLVGAGELRTESAGNAPSAMRQRQHFLRRVLIEPAERAAWSAIKRAKNEVRSVRQSVEVVSH
jgi:hypothetical protein